MTPASTAMVRIEDEDRNVNVNIISLVHFFQIKEKNLEIQLIIFLTVLSPLLRYQTD